jgi:predicted GNAT family acetyltransferase
MNVRRHDEAEAFRVIADAFLMREPARNQLPIMIAHTLATQPDVYPEFHLWTVADDDGEVVAAAVRTPPHNVALADPVDEVALDALVDAIAADDPEAPGVVGNRPWSDRFARRWTAGTGQLPRVSVAQGVFELTRVILPRESSGSARRAGPQDRPVIEAWFEAFADEALPPELAERSRQRSRLDGSFGEGDHVGFWLWEDDGRPRSMTGFSTFPLGARIGPVYTPPEERGRGFASHVVAFASQTLMDAGANACFLYTDLANPTSNKIYVDLGYVQVAESDNIEFDEPGAV